MSDAINPDHYKRLPAEAIEIIEAMIAGAPDNKAAYLHGQAAKYDLRLWKKGKSLEDFLSDWGKHIWYALRLESHLLELIEKQKADEQQKAADLQSLKDHPFGKLKKPAWTPKIGDWVQINAPEPGDPMHTKTLEDLDGQTLQVVGLSEFDKRYAAFESDHGSLYVLIDLLEPAEPPKPTLNSDKIPEGYRKLNDSSEEPRQLGDLRWSVAEKRYIEISVDEIGYANRDNWAACRKVELAIKQSLTPEPPDGWRWLEVGEVIRKGDKPKNGNAVPSFWIGTPCCNNQFILRRNKFEVGEKVVHGDCNSLSISVVENILGDGWVDLVRDGVSTAYHVKDLAPYIEDAK